MLVKVTTESGIYTHFEINCTNIEGAKEYFLDYVRYYPKGDNLGKELIVKVEEVK